MNFGAWYKKKYFDNIKIILDDRTSNDGKKNNDNVRYRVNEVFNVNPIINVTDVEKTLPNFPEDNEIGVTNSFELKTLYPGLLCGIGYPHEINQENEDKEDEDDKKDKDAPTLLNLGMYFDHSTGLPTIPGSSIKGAMRAAIEEWDFLNSDIWKEELGNHPEFSSINLDNEPFVKQVFEGKKSDNPYQRDVFFDAIPVKVENKLFGIDYITHHPSPLKNPNPVSFLRVEPGVTFKFRMRLSDIGVSKEYKELLFKTIILNFGLGAKTNVGYGHFENEA